MVAVGGLVLLVGHNKIMLQLLVECGFEVTDPGVVSMMGKI